MFTTTNGGYEIFCAFGGNVKYINWCKRNHVDWFIAELNYVIELVVLSSEQLNQQKQTLWQFFWMIVHSISATRGPGCELSRASSLCPQWIPQLWCGQMTEWYTLILHMHTSTNNNINLFGRSTWLISLQYMHHHEVCICMHACI